MSNLTKSGTVISHWPSDSDWTDVLAAHLQSDSFQELCKFVDSARKLKTVFPPEEDVFRAFEFSSFHETNVVILGQDPYHGPGQAHGLSFSVAGDQKLPPSLRNIYKELKSDLGIENTTGDLSHWARQGVLLLNTVLTVENGKANSHKNRGWEEFTDRAIEAMGKRKRPAVFVLWGNQAAKKSKLIDPNHTILASPHPSPLSAHRGFFGSKPFSTINRQLSAYGEKTIDWRLKVDNLFNHIKD